MRNISYFSTVGCGHSFRFHNIHLVRLLKVFLTKKTTSTAMPEKLLHIVLLVLIYTVCVQLFCIVTMWLSMSLTVRNNCSEFDIIIIFLLCSRVNFGKNTYWMAEIWMAIGFQEKLQKKNDANKNVWSLLCS